MIKHIKPYKIDVGDTIIFTGTRTKKIDDDLYMDNSDHNLIGQRLLVVIRANYSMIYGFQMMI